MYRREKNNGKHDVLWTENPNQAAALRWNYAMCESQYTTPNLPKLFQNSATFICDTEDPAFSRMVDNILGEREFALDLEGHDEHSYLGKYDCQYHSDHVIFYIRPTSKDVGRNSGTFC